MEWDKERFCKKTQYDTIATNTKKKKNNKKHQLQFTRKNKQQLSDIAKFVNEQAPVSTGKCLGPKPAQAEPQQHQY